LKTYQLIKSRGFGLIAKTTLILCLGYLLYGQLFVENDLSALVAEFQKSMVKNGNWIWCILAILLMPLNWALEMKKWSILVSRFQEFSSLQSLKSVLSGVSLAIMTPGRLGEYGGRLLGIESENRPKAILSNLLLSLSQNIVNIGIGLLLALVFLYQFMDIQRGVFISLFCGSIIVGVILLTLFFRVDLLGGILAYLPRYNWVIKLEDSISSIAEIEKKTLFRILNISMLRYGVYLFQYVFFIHFFGVTEDTVSAILGVGTIFFLQSNLPLPPVLSVFARGEMAIFLWSVFTDNVLGIIAATFSLWILNLVIPAILGAIVISSSRIFK